MSESYHNYFINKGPTELDQEFESKLIRAVYNLKWLYDSNHPDFNNVSKTKIAWARVAHICQKSFSECTNKWNLLLQTYFSSTSSSNWIHHEELKKFEPHLHNNFRITNQINPSQKPSQAQKDELLSVLWNNRSKLLATQTLLVERQKIWSTITFKCNSIQPGAYMGALDWKKYWYDIKQNFGAQRFMLRSKLKARGTKLDVSIYTNEDLKILQICGVSSEDTVGVIVSALGNNIELGFHTDLIIPKCLKCLRQRNELIVDGYCETCHNYASCYFCNTVCDANIVKYKTANWSKIAKSLLPVSFESNDEILLCVDCSNKLNEAATFEWKVCRICETENPNLQNLYENSNYNLRKAFTTATTFEFNEFDGLPGYVCKVCKIQMTQLSNFYMKFWRTQCKLRAVHSIQFIGELSDTDTSKTINLGNVIEKAITKQVISATPTSSADFNYMQNDHNSATIEAVASSISTLLPIESITISKPTNAVVQQNYIPKTTTATIVQNCFPITASKATTATVQHNYLPITTPKATTTTIQQNCPPITTSQATSITKPNCSTIISSKVTTIPKTIAQQHLQGTNPGTKPAQYRRILVKKSVTEIGPPTTTTTTTATASINAVQEGVGAVSKTPIPTNPPLAIKEIFSLNTLSSNGKPNIKVIPTVALQQAKVHGVFSNETVTVTRKTIDIPSSQAPSQTTSINNNTKQSISIINRVNGNNVQLQPTSNAMLSSRGFTLNKRLNEVLPKPSQPQSPALTNIQKFMKKILPKPETTTNKLGPKPSASSKPAIFTISDLETIEDAPPVFCIPRKNVQVSNNAEETEAEKQLRNFNPSNAPIIKTEVLDQQECPREETAQIQKNVIQVTDPLSTEKPIETEASKNSGMKVIRLNGQMVAVKPHPHIIGAFIPVDLSTRSESEGSNRISTIIRKVDNGQKSQVATGNTTLKKLPQFSEKPAPPPMPPFQEPTVGPSDLAINGVQFPSMIPAPIINQQSVPEVNILTPQQIELFLQAHPHHQHQLQQQQQNQLQQYQQQQKLQQEQQLHHQQQVQQQNQLQQQQQEQQQQGLKKPRKYWGNVDEFHVAPVPTKTSLPQLQTPPSSLSNSMPTFQPPTEIRPLQPMQQTPSAPWIEERKTPAPTEDPLNVQTPSNIKIKQEVFDNYIEETNIPNTPNDTTPAMFYPDSFELGNVTFEADVSLIIDNLIIQQNSIIDRNNMNSNNFDKYINPAFPISYGKRKLVDDVKEKEMEMKRKKDDDAKAELEEDAEKKRTRKQENEEKNKMKDDKKDEKDSTKSSPMKMKKVCVKVKRNKVHIFTSRPKRSCTLLQGQSKNSPSPAAAPAPPLRKSLRLNQT